MSSFITAPMLAADVDVRKGALAKLRFPLIATPKFDGIRCVKVGGRALSRKFLPIPNDFVREYVEKYVKDGMDGELLVGGVEIGKTFSEYSAGIMRKDGEPDFTFHAFDWVRRGLEVPYHERIMALEYRLGLKSRKRISFVPYTMLTSLDDLESYEGQLLELGYEGVILRHPEGPYKCGRSTFNQHWLLKLKRFIDGDALVIGMIEMMHNTNEAKKDELGHTKRSSAKAGKVPAGMVGAFQMRDLKDGREFEIGTGRGLTLELRKKFWEERHKHIGKTIFKYKRQASGEKNKPRVGSYLGIRDPKDMS